VLTCRYAYTRVRKAGAFGGRKAGTGLPTRCPTGRAKCTSELHLSSATFQSLLSSLLQHVSAKSLSMEPTWSSCEPWS